MVSQKECNILTGNIFGLRKESNANEEGSKGDFEVCVLRIESQLLDSGLSYIAGKRFIYVPKATVDVIGAALCEHLNRAVRHVADKAG